MFKAEAVQMFHDLLYHFYYQVILKAHQLEKEIVVKPDITPRDGKVTEMWGKNQFKILLTLQLA